MAHELDQLEREAEAQRALLTREIDAIRIQTAETIQELHERIVPKRIALRMLEKLRSLIERSARDNPVQVAGVAVLIAYPLWRLARALPLPMVIAGAGVFLASKARFSTAQANELIVEARGRAQDAASRLLETTEQLRDGAARDLQDVQARAAAGASGASEVIKDAGRSAAVNIRDSLERAADSASAAVSRAVEAMTPSEAVVQTTKDNAEAIADAAEEIAKRAIHSSAAYSRDAVRAAVENPLLIAGLGLAAGGLLAAFLPRTRADSKMLGGLASTVRASAKRAVNEGHQVVSNAVGDVYDRAGEEAQARGLTVDAVRGLADDIHERASDAAAAKRAIKRNVRMPEESP